MSLTPEQRDQYKRAATALENWDSFCRFLDMEWERIGAKALREAEAIVERDSCKNSPRKWPIAAGLLRECLEKGEPLT